MIPVLAVLAAFAAMEGVSYVTHRWVMHGVGMPWHRSHHAPAAGRFERNDRFPVLFAGVGVGLFVLGALGLRAAWWVGLGVTAYGAAYLFVHEVYIHRRLPVPVPHLRYLEWLRDAHRMHHQGGGEPYGMLLPLGVRTAPSRGRGRDPLERSVS
jgi:beta-carotene 3-hydroxylase